MSKKVILKSSDGASFEIDEAVAVYSKTIANMIEDGCAKTEILLGDVKGNTLAKVIEYCKKHVDAAVSSTEETKDDLKKWDDEFMKGMTMDQSTRFDVVSAANYLQLTDLLDLSCQTIADMMAEKSPEEMRMIFNIENDYTPEEEEALRREYPWVFQ